MDEYLTANEVAAILKVHPETVKHWLRDKHLKGFRLSDRAGWRVSRADLQAFIEDREQHGAIERESGDD